MAKEKEIEKPKEENTPPKEIEKKVEDKKEAAKAEGVPAAAVNPIGEIEKPDDDAPASEWKDWAKKVDDRLDKLVAACVKESKEPKSEGYWDKW